MVFKFFPLNEELKINESEDILYLKEEWQFNEFFENVTFTDKIILKEEKETMFFYLSLNKDNKKLFNIKTYFDCIDIAYNYYSLISALIDSNISIDMIEAQSWQEKYLKAVYEIHKNMLIKSEELKIAPRYMKYINTQINHSYYNKYKKIIFVNKLYTTNQEKKILESLNIDVEYHLYCNEKDFDKQRLILTDITIDNVDKNIKAYATKDKTSLIIKLLEILDICKNKKEDLYIVDFEKDKNMYNGINENLFDYKKETFMNTTKIYKVLNYIYKILENKELYQIYLAILDKDFTKFCNLSMEEINLIKKYTSMGLKYINITEINNLNNIVTMDLKDLVSKLADSFKDEAFSFLEASSEIFTLDSFGFSDIVKTKLDKIKLILKYLDAKKIEYKLKNKEFEISKLDMSCKEKLLVLNAHIQPKTKINEYILSSSQYAKLNLINSSMMKYVELYPYIRQIMLSKEALILYISNIEIDTELNSMFRNLLYKLNVKEEIIEYTNKSILSFLNDSKESAVIKKDTVFLKAEDTFDISDMNKNEFHITSYDIYPFLKYPIVYFMRKYISKKINNIIPSKNSIDNTTLGVIVHKYFEKEVYNSSEDIVNSYKNYILDEYFEIYKNLIFNPLKDDVKVFYNNNNIVDTEKKIEKRMNNLSLSFRLDVLTDREIIDIKTSSKLSKKEYIDQLKAYNAILDNIYDMSLYNPLSKESYRIDKKDLITLDLLEQKSDEYRNCSELVAQKDIEDYDLKDIIRGSDYEM